MNISLIGAGRIAWQLENDKLRYKPCTHAGTLTHSAEIQKKVAWQSVCDTDLKKAHACLKFIEHKTGRKISAVAETDFTACLAMHPDILIIATDTPAHAEIAAKALRQNVPVIILEKPVALTGNDALKLRKLSEKSASRIFVNYERRYHPKYKKLRKDTADRTFGKPLYYRGFFMAGNKKLYPYDRGDGILLHDTTHLLDLVMYVFGTPVSFEGSVFSHETRNESHNLRLMHEDGLTGEISSLAGSAVFHFELEVVYEKARVRVGNGFYMVEKAGKSTSYTNFQVWGKPEFIKDARLKIDENPFIKLYQAVLTGSSNAHAFSQACRNVQILCAE